MLVYRLVIAFGFSLFRVLDVRRTVRGVENIPREGGAVLAITHFSYLDFALAEWMVWKHLHRFTSFMATAASFKHPVAGPLMRAMKHIPVEQGGGASAYRHAVTALQDGQLVGVFPESRVTRSFELLPLKSGAARMAGQAGVPIVPIVLWGSHRVLTRTHKQKLWKARHVPVKILVGEPMHPSSTDTADAVTAELRTRLEALLTEARAAYPLDGTGQWWQTAALGGTAPTPDDAQRIDDERTLTRKLNRKKAA